MMHTEHDVAFTNGYPRPCEYDGQGIVWSGNVCHIPKMPSWRSIVEYLGHPGARFAIIIGHECTDCGLVIRNPKP